MARLGIERCVLAVSVGCAVALIVSPTSALSADFDCDGWDDIAIGDSGDPKNNPTHVIYGSSPGLSDRDQVIKDGLWSSDGADGDFNRDGCADLAIIAAGSPADRVKVFYGSPNGLGTPGQIWAQGRDGVPGTPNTYDLFGSAIETGDFDGDGYGDLAIGNQLDVETNKDGLERQRGSVTIIYGSPTGLVGTGSQRFSKGTDDDGLPGSEGSGLGSSLAAGDFNGDGRDELAIGDPQDEIAPEDDSGSVIVLRGTASGLTEDGAAVWNWRTSGVEGASQPNADFGYELASGDFDGSGQKDLVISSYQDGSGKAYGAGAVNVLYGGANGLSADGDQIWSQSKLKGKPERGDEFGASLATGDFDGDGADEMVVGVREQLASQRNTILGGGVHIVFGAPDGLLTPGGLTSDRELFLHAGSNALGGKEHALNFVGANLVAGRFAGNDAALDLALSASRTRLRSFRHVGVVFVLRGQNDGRVGNKGSLQISQAQPGILGRPESFDSFAQEMLVG